MAAYIDLHMHSTFSDGRDSVKALMLGAAGLPDLAAIALTDHDSANGSAVLRRYRQDITGSTVPKIIDGIEVSVAWQGKVLHLLGYFPAGGLNAAHELRELCRRNVDENRKESVLRFGPATAVQRLEKRHREILGSEPGFELGGILEAVAARHQAKIKAARQDLGEEPLWPFPPAGRTWREVLHQRGVAPISVLECFVARDRAREAVLINYWEDLLKRGRGRNVKPDEAALIRQAAQEDLGFILNAEESCIDLATGIAAVKGAGGVPVLAHPVPSLKLQAESFDEQLRAVAAVGLSGFEAYYPLHSEVQTERIAGFCQENDLVLSGGTDYHGKQGARIGDLGGGRRVPVLAIVEALAC